MKNILVAVFALILTSTTFAQQNKLTAVFGKEKGNFTQTQTGSETKFVLNTSHAEIEKLKAKASEIADKMTLIVEAKSNNNYQCILKIDHQNHAEYVHKMFVFLGIEKINIDGKERPLEDLIAYLKGLK